jgi:hypothetical protein
MLSRFKIRGGMQTHQLQRQSSPARISHSSSARVRPQDDDWGGVAVAANMSSGQKPSDVIALDDHEFGKY